MNWARARVFEVVQLLESAADPDSVRATDYMLDHLSADTTPIPDLVWETASGTSSLPAADASTLAMSAYQAHRLQTAVALWKRVAGSNHPDAAPEAAFNLGVLEQEQGDVPAARAAYQRAIDSGHAEHAPAAAVNLGVLEQEQGDLSAARAAYQRAIDSGHAEHAPAALVNLGILEQQQGEWTVTLGS